MHALKPELVPLELWQAQFNQLAMERWISYLRVAQVFNLHKVPGYQSVQDGAIGAFAEVNEGQCQFAIDYAEDHNMRGLHDLVVRYRIPLSDRINAKGRDWGFTDELRRVVFPSKGLQAFFSVVIPISDPRRLLSSFQAILPRLVRVDPNDMENGGKLFENCVSFWDTHHIIKTPVDSKAEALDALYKLERLPGVRYAVLFLELES